MFEQFFKLKPESKPDSLQVGSRSVPLLFVHHRRARRYLLRLRQDGPGAGFRIFNADTFLLVAGFNVCRLTFLFVSVAGFITLWHWWCSLSGGTLWAQCATPLRFFSHNRRRL